MNGQAGGRHPGVRERHRAPSLAQTVYAQLKDDIAEFRLLPGDRFTEGELAERLSVSRTPVREALQRLEKEGWLEVRFRSGWSVRPLDFAQFEHLYDLRIVLETAAVRQLCDRVDRIDHGALLALRGIWCVRPEARAGTGPATAGLDEDFHASLVMATGNPEMARVHREVTERIRIVRRLDFTLEERVAATYREHEQILRAVIARRPDQAALLLKSHIETSKAEVRKISLHQLWLARQG